MTTNLKLCPFCGGAGDLIEDYGYLNRKFWFVQCRSGNCPVGPGTQEGADTEADAITAWNTRADDREAIAAAVSAERARIMDELAEQEDVIMDFGAYYVAGHAIWRVVNPGVEPPADGGKVPKPFREDGEP